MTETDVYFAEDGTPRSARFGDIYYSPQDGLAESRAVFLEGCHLAEAWRRACDFTVLELGFGTGLNIAALLELWTRSECPGRMHIFTVEAFVMARDQAATALANWPEIAQFAQAITDQWPRERRGFHHMDFPQWRVSVTIALMKVEPALEAWDGRADAVFLDGFSPALNPDMWSPAVFGRIADRVRPGARLATFTVAGHVRRGLQDAGFSVAKCPGFGRKRERLEAAFGGEAVQTGRPQRIAIAGAGIAGACLAWQARLFGVEADIYDPAPGRGASGNPAALVTPRLDAGDNAISALFADAFAYATAFYRQWAPSAVLGRGVRQCALEERDLPRFARIAQQAGFVAGDLTPFDAGEIAEAPGLGGLYLKPALWVEPKEVLDVLLAGTNVFPASLPDDHCGYDAVVLACGDGILDRADIELPLRPVRGQVEWAAGAELDGALAWGGYAVPLRDGLLFGATHDRDDRRTDVRAESRSANLDNLARVLPQRAEALRGREMISRASVRVTSRDHLPAAGEIAPGCYVLTGLGSRGFCLAPLLAKAVLAEITGFAPPMAATTKKLLRPGRFGRD